MKIIGLAGAKRSGKNTAGEFIRDVTVGHVRLIGFADKLKIAAARAIGQNGSEEELISMMDEAKEEWELEVWNPNSDHVYTFSGRQYLQWWGTEAGRNTFGEDFWIDQVLPDPTENLTRTAVQSALKGMYPRVDTLVITDVRFPNEAERVRAVGGTVLEIRRARRGDRDDEHASETPLPRELVDHSLFNNGSLGDLRNNIKEVLSSC